MLNALTTNAPSGSYFVVTQVRAPHPQAADAEVRRQLREVSRQLTGLE